MNNSDMAQKAHACINELKTEVLRQIDELNAIANGAMEDGYQSTHLDDGWISLKGVAWGFVVHYDDPVRIDMTFGPDSPFVGYRSTFIAKNMNGRIVWANKELEAETFMDCKSMARYGLRKLAHKVGDAGLFDRIQAEHLYKPESQRSISAGEVF